MLTIYLTAMAIVFFSDELKHKPQDSSLYVIQEEFSNLENWEAFSFSRNKNPTEYTIHADTAATYLKIVSQNSASGLIYKDHFNPNEYPTLTWRWRVESVISEADGKIKSEDDFPIRLFIMFDDDSVETSFWTSIRNSAIKLMYGTEPPETSLCFVWANIKYEEEYFDSPYSETVKILPMEMGDNRLNQWYTYNVNIVNLYREIFNRSCPVSAKLALMGDTDNTGSHSLAYVDYIKINKD